MKGIFINCIGCIVTAAVQWNVVVKICCLKSNKITFHYLLKKNLMMYVSILIFIFYYVIMSLSFNALTLLVGRQEGLSACKN